MDENNQYGNATTKPLRYGCIKKASKIPSLLELKKILDHIPHTDKIGHPFIIAIKFHNENEKMTLFNEIYTPIFGKNKVIQVHQRSVLQLISIIMKDEKKDLVRSFETNTKTHSTLEGKKFIPLYAEHIHFVAKRAGWLVTRIHQHFTFVQSKF